MHRELNDNVYSSFYVRSVVQSGKGKPVPARGQEMQQGNLYECFVESWLAHARIPRIGFIEASILLA